MSIMDIKPLINSSDFALALAAIDLAIVWLDKDEHNQRRVAYLRNIYKQLDKKLVDATVR